MCRLLINLFQPSQLGQPLWKPRVHVLPAFKATLSALSVGATPLETALLGYTNSELSFFQPSQLGQYLWKPQEP